MKKGFFLIALTVFFLGTLSCSKDDDDDLIDCTAESALVVFDASIDVSDPKLVSFKIEYSGTRAIKDIEWIFGDGGTDTTTTLNTTHIYTATGNYTAVVKVQLENRGDICTVEQTEAVTIN